SPRPPPPPCPNRRPCRPPPRRTRPPAARPGPMATPRRRASGRPARPPPSARRHRASHNSPLQSSCGRQPPAASRHFRISMLNVVILAAGLGKRMQSDLPKVLHSLAGKPMLEHVLDSASQLEPGRIVVVVGHGADRVRGAYEGRADLSFAL